VLKKEQKNNKTSDTIHIIQKKLEKILWPCCFSMKITFRLFHSVFIYNPNSCVTTESEKMQFSPRFFSIPQSNDFHNIYFRQCRGRGFLTVITFILIFFLEISWSKIVPFLSNLFISGFYPQIRKAVTRNMSKTYLRLTQKVIAFSCIQTS